MSNEWPKMMFLHGTTEWKIAHSLAESKELTSFGFAFERWPVEAKEIYKRPGEPLPMPRQEAPKKEDPKQPDKPKKSFPKWKCDYCGKHLKRFSHANCGKEVSVNAIEKETVQECEQPETEQRADA